MSKNNTLAEAFSRGLKSDPTLTYADWAQKYFMLPGAKTAVNLTFTPYLIQPLIDFSWSAPYRKFFWMKGVQVAASTFNDIVVCATVDCFRKNLIFYSQTDAMALEYVKVRLNPCFENNPKLRGKVHDGYDRKGNSTLGLKLIQGAALKFCGGTADRNYRNFAAATVIMDDIDGFPRDIGGTEKRKGQGSPAELGPKRTNAQRGKYKIMISGSPTDTKTSIIYRKFKETNQKYYHIPCVHCNHLQVIEFERIIYKKNALDKITQNPKMECIKCNKLIDEKHKYNMMQVNNGAKWIATQESNDPLVVGLHLSSLYSLLGYTWLDIAKEFILANKHIKIGNYGPIRTFKNTVLGLPTEEKKQRSVVTHSKLYNSRENYEKVPENGIIITAGVDIQAQRIEVLVAANGTGSNVYCLEYKVIGGNTLIEYGLEGSPFNELENFLNKTYKNFWDHEQPILHTCIDTGFRSIIVSPFLEKMTEKNYEITGIFGSSQSKKRQKTFVGEPIKNKYDVQQREINVNEGKTLNYHRLKNGLIHFNFHPSFTESFFKQLTVEWWDSKEQRWMCADHAKNEGTDMLNYLTAACNIYTNNGNVDWEDFKKWNKNGCQIYQSLGMTVIDDGIKIR
jgi:phage terminase large subunit GpA-like protein